MTASLPRDVPGQARAQDSDREGTLSCLLLPYFLQSPQPQLVHCLSSSQAPLCSPQLLFQPLQTFDGCSTPGAARPASCARHPAGASEPLFLQAGLYLIPPQTAAIAQLQDASSPCPAAPQPLWDALSEAVTHMAQGEPVPHLCCPLLWSILNHS